MKRHIEIALSYEPRDEVRVLQVLKIILDSLKEAFPDPSPVSVHVDVSEKQTERTR